MNQIKKRILLPVDGSKTSQEAARYAAGFFPSGKIEIVLYHVFNKVPEFYYDLAEESPFRRAILDIIEWEDARNDSIEEFLAETRRVLIDEGVPEDHVKVDIRERRSG